MERWRTVSRTCKRINILGYSFDTEALDSSMSNCESNLARSALDTITKHYKPLRLVCWLTRKGGQRKGIINHNEI